MLAWWTLLAAAAPPSAQVVGAVDLAWGGDRIAVLTDDGTVVVLDADTGVRLAEHRSGLRRGAESVQVSADGSTALVQGYRHSKVVDLERGRTRRVGEARFYDELALSPTGSSVLWSDDDLKLTPLSGGRTRTLAFEGVWNLGWVGGQPWARIGRDLVIYDPKSWDADARFVRVPEGVQAWPTTEGGAVGIDDQGNWVTVGRDGATTRYAASADAWSAETTADGAWGLHPLDRGFAVTDLRTGDTAWLPASEWSRQAAWSPDGSRIAVLDEAVVRVVERAELVDPLVPSVRLADVAFTRGGDVTAIWSQGRAATFAGDTGEVLAEGWIPVPMYGTRTLAIRPDGHVLAADGEGWIHEWGPQDGAFVEVVDAGFPRAGEEITLHPSGAWAVRVDRSVHVYGPDGALRGQVEVAWDSALAIGPEGRCVAHGSERVVLHDLQEDRETPVVTDPPEALTLDEGCVLNIVTGGDWTRWRDGKGERQFSGPWGTSGRVSGTRGILWNPEEATAWVVIDGDVAAELPMWGEDAALSDDGARAVVSDPYGSLVVWDVESGTRRWFFGAPGPIVDVAARGDRIVAAIGGGASVSDGDGFRELASADVTAVGMLADGTVLLGDREGGVRSAESGRLLVEGSDEPVLLVDAAGDGFVRYDGNVQVFGPDGTPRSTDRTGEVVADGGLVAVRDWESMALSTGGGWLERPYREGRKQWIGPPLAACEGGRVLLAGTWDPRLYVHGPGDRRPRASRVEGHGQVGACAGAAAAIGLVSSDVAIVDLATEEVLALLPGDGAEVRDLEMPRSDRVVIGRANGVLEVWDLGDAPRRVFRGIP